MVNAAGYLEVEQILNVMFASFAIILPHLFAHS